MLYGIIVIKNERQSIFFVCMCIKCAYKTQDVFVHTSNTLMSGISLLVMMAVLFGSKKVSKTH